MAQEEGWPAVHARLAGVDPETARRLDPNDAQRIQRALEIYHITGKTLGELLRKPRYVYFPYTPIRIALIPSDRARLHEEIEKRFDHMLAAGLVADEFDISFFQDKSLDHGCFSPLCMLWPHQPTWPGAIIPLQVGVLQIPGPSARRCFKLGQSLRKAVESYPKDLKVVIVATGGLSHQVHGERCGFNNTEWDMQFLDLLEKDPQQLTQMTVADLARAGGWEGAEVVMWLVMRGALSPRVKKLHQSYYLPSMTALATAIYEDQGDAPEPASIQAYREHMQHETAGAEKLEGTYPYTLERSVKAYRLNKFLHRLVEPAHRERFLADPEATFEEAKLTAEERAMIRDRSWRDLIHYGVIFFLLEKLGAVVGVSNLHIYAAMRGQSLDDFQKTRNAQVLYSVAGDSNKMAWEKKS